MSADTAIMPIPGPIDPVPVPRAAKPRADGKVELVGLAKVGGESDSQQTFLLQVFRRLVAGQRGRDVSLEAIAAAASDPESIGLDDPDQLIKKSERTKLARKLLDLGCMHGRHPPLRRCAGEAPVQARGR